MNFALTPTNLPQVSMELAGSLMVVKTESQRNAEEGEQISDWSHQGYFYDEVEDMSDVIYVERWGMAATRQGKHFR